MPSVIASLVALLASTAAAMPGALDQRAACNADNCLRAVRGSAVKPGPSSATADCSAFMHQTVQGCDATVTASTTITYTTAPVTVTAGQAPASRRAALADRGARDARAATCAASTFAGLSAVPTYASACSGVARYSSACACAGIPASTVTRAPSTVTVTPTSTFTPTVTVTAPTQPSVPAGACQTFLAKASGGNFDGQYFAYGPAGRPYLVLTADRAAAVRFVRNGAGQVVDPATGRIWMGLDSYSDVALYPPAQPAFDFQPILCNVATDAQGNVEGTMACVGQQGTRVFQSCENEQNLVVFDSFVNQAIDDCVGFNAVAVPAC